MNIYFIYIADLNAKKKMPHSQTKLEEVKTRRQKKKKTESTNTYIHIYIHL